MGYKKLIGCQEENHDPLIRLDKKNPVRTLQAEMPVERTGSKE